ncbi:MAG: hypothetical protein AB7H77_11940 [Bdellovibrionales bacterium]
MAAALLRPVVTAAATTPAAAPATTPAAPVIAVATIRAAILVMTRSLALRLSVLREICGVVSARKTLRRGAVWQSLAGRGTLLRVMILALLRVTIMTVAPVMVAFSAA